MADASTLAPAPAPPHNGRLRLRTLVLIRWIALIGQTTTLAVVYFGLGYAIPFVPAMAVIAASGALNVVISIARPTAIRSEEHTSELQSLMRISYAVFCLKKTKHHIAYNR